MAASPSLYRFSSEPSFSRNVFRIKSAARTAACAYFGTYAKGLTKKDSDIDIYIETKSRNVKKTIEEIHSKINVKIGTFDTKSPLIKGIIKDHVIIRGIEVFYDKQVPE